MAEIIKNSTEKENTAMVTADEYQNGLNEVTKARKAGNLVIVIGAGVSADSILTAWDIVGEILMELNTASKDVYKNILCNDPAQYGDKIRDIQFEKFLQHIYEILGPEKFQRILNCFFGKTVIGKTGKRERRKPTSALMVLAQAMKNNSDLKVLSTNMDRLLETAYNDNTFKPKIKDSDFAPPYEGGLYKLHGSVEDKDSCVATLFVEGAGYSGNKRKFLKDIFKNNTVWFVGYSLADYDMMLLLYELLEQNFPFKQLVFNLYHEDGPDHAEPGDGDNVQLIRPMFNMKGQGDRIGFTCGDAEKQLKKALKIKKLPVSGKKSKKNKNFPILKSEQATILLAKLLGAVGRGDKNYRDVTRPLFKIVQQSQDMHLRVEAMHQIAQSLSVCERDEKIRWAQRAHRVAKCRKGVCVRPSHKKMRLDTIRIESLRIMLSVKNDTRAVSRASDFDRLVCNGKCLCNKYKNGKDKHHFKVLYYRCLNERALFLYRSGHIFSHLYAFWYLIGFAQNRTWLGDLDVNVRALHLLSLLRPGYKRQSRRKAEFIYHLLNQEFMDMENIFKKYPPAPQP